MNTQKTINTWQEAMTYLCGRLDNIELATQRNTSNIKLEKIDTKSFVNFT